jgi:PAS domain S-box-containing protein
VRDWVGHLGEVDKAGLFDALELAAARVGLALFVVHVDASPPSVVYASALLGELVGRPCADLIGRPPWELVASDQQQRVRETIASRGPGAPPITLEFAIERPDGSRRDIDVSVARVPASGAELALCYFRDTTFEHDAVVALRRSEAHFRSLIECGPDAVVILQNGRFVLANPLAVRMFGMPDFEAVRGRQLSDFLPPAEAARATERIRQLDAGGQVESSEYRILHDDLVVEVHSVRCEYGGQPAILSFVRDATERRRMQEQIFRADRLAALGTLAATVAHEINNPLAYLALNLQRLQQEAGAEPDPARAARLRDLVASASHGAERVARIVRDLREYSRDHSDAPDEAVDVVAVVDQALLMVAHDLSHRCRLIRRNPGERAIIDGNAGHLEQVVVNLLVNALQALEGAEDRRNEISVAVELAGDDVRILVADTGPGIASPERVFEPFFTTKPTSEGTGLGLAVCKQLAGRLRGRIEIESTGKQGTTFVVTLPRRRAPVAARIEPPAQTTGERLRLLVIDDEPNVLGAMQEILSFDHDVDVVGDGEGGLAKLRDGHYDVILCDLMMPRMSGREVYDRIREQWPGRERRIVFVTGGAFVPALAAFLEAIDNLKLDKPFTIESVLALVRDAKQRADQNPTE